MTTRELHEILDNENASVDFAELQQIVYELKTDALREAGENPRDRFYLGEANAFQIALDLMEHYRETG